MKLRFLVAFAALTAMAAAGPDRPGFTTPPSWIDLDENGEIDAVEREAFIQARKDAARGLMEDIDTDGDGEISETEREAAIEALRAKAEERLCTLFEGVAGEDGFISQEDFMTIPVVARIPGRIADMMFAFLNTDGSEDGISKEEFLAAFGGRRSPVGPPAPPIEPPVPPIP